MTLRRLSVLLTVLALAAPATSMADDDDEERVPVYEVNFAAPLATERCVLESEYDQPTGEYYGDKCHRLRFVFGPILAEPGTNDILIQPTTIEQPRWFGGGYMVRWKPGLVDQLGAVPPVEDLHLHHGTWVLSTGDVGTSPFFATGEEQTILSYPKGYGQFWGQTNVWAFLHMIHNADASPRLVYVTWDVDWIAAADAATWVNDSYPEGHPNRTGIKHTRAIWLDAGSSCGGWTGHNADGSLRSESSGCSSYTANPIFNVQKGFGAPDDGAFRGSSTRPRADTNRGSGKRVCYFPKENCAYFNSAGNVSAQQGAPKAPGSVLGWDRTISTASWFRDGWATLVHMGGHLHPGGVRTEISLVRNMGTAADPDWQERPIFISDAFYWNVDDPKKVGKARPNSWDLAMGTVDQRKGGWKVAIRQGDRLRINGVYDTEVMSSYEQMAIAMGWIVAGREEDALDPFDENVILDARFPAGAPIPGGYEKIAPGGCDRNNRAITDPQHPDYGKQRLCLRGTPSRPSQRSRRNHGDCRLTGTCPPLPSTRIPLPQISNSPSGPNYVVPMQGFAYGPLDMALALGTPPVAGANPLGLGAIRSVAPGTRILFTNPDAAMNVWHTVTRCALPCTGPTQNDYPTADGGDDAYFSTVDGLPAADPFDFDSATLGYGLGKHVGNEYTMDVPNRPGVYTFWCRIHPQMRGVFAIE